LSFENRTTGGRPCPDSGKATAAKRRYLVSRRRTRRSLRPLPLRRRRTQTLSPDKQTVTSTLVANAERQHAREPGDLRRACAGRPVREGASRTADVYAAEESDCGVGTDEAAEQRGQPSAEVAEGRPRTKENFVESHRSSTPGGERLSQGLSGVRQAARERKQEKFTALLHPVTTDLLRQSFGHERRCKGLLIRGQGRHSSSPQGQL